jgi:recombination protein RecA
MSVKKTLHKAMHDGLTDKGKDTSIVFFGKHPTYGLVTNCISTGAPSLDRIIAKDISGRWGIPCGRTSFISGKPGSGKTTLSLHLCAETQRRGGIAFIIDGEHKLDRLYAKTLGVNVDDLLYYAPYTLEEVLESIHKSIDTVKDLRKDSVFAKEIENIPILIIVDSVSIATKAEKEAEEVGKGAKGVHAKIMSEFLRNTIPEISKLNIAILFVCQIKSKINIGYGGGRGTKETFLAEDTLRFHCTIGLRTQRISTLRDSKNNRYADIDLYVTTKNSCIPPFQEAEIELRYGKGFNYYVSLTDTLLEYYEAESKGSWYSHPDIGKWQGKDGLRKLLEKNPKQWNNIDKILRSPAKIKIGAK